MFPQIELFTQSVQKAMDAGYFVTHIDEDGGFTKMATADEVPDWVSECEICTVLFTADGQRRFFISFISELENVELHDCSYSDDETHPINQFFGEWLEQI